MTCRSNWPLPQSRHTYQFFSKLPYFSPFFFFLIQKHFKDKTSSGCTRRFTAFYIHLSYFVCSLVGRNLRYCDLWDMCGWSYRWPEYLLHVFDPPQPFSAHSSPNPWDFLSNKNTGTIFWATWSLVLGF